MIGSKKIPKHYINFQSVIPHEPINNTHFLRVSEHPEAHTRFKLKVYISAHTRMCSVMGRKERILPLLWKSRPLTAK